MGPWGGTDLRFL